MVDFNKFNNKILIVPSGLKPYFINKKSANPTLNFKIFYLREIEKEIFGSISENALAYVFKNTKFSASLIERYFAYIERGLDPNFNDEVKLIYSLLKEKFLIYRDHDFSKIFEDKEVIFVGFSKDDREILHVIKAGKIETFSFVKLEDLFEKRIQNVLHFGSIIDELKYVFTKICDLLNSGVSAKEILLITDEKNNKFYLDLFSDKYGIKLNYEKKKTLFDAKIAKTILNNLDQINENNIDSYDDKSDEFKQIKQIFTKYNLYISEDKPANYAYFLKKIDLEEKTIYEGIKVSKSLIFDDSKNIFVTDVNNNFYKKIKKNNEIIDDKVKSEFSLRTTDDENLLSSKLYENFFNLNDKMCFSYSDASSSKGNETLSFFFVKKYNDKSLIKEGKNLDYEYDKSVAFAYYSNIKTIKELFKYNSENFFKYYNAFGKIKLFDNSYTQIEKLPFEIENKKISYSEIDTFFKCPFQYFCKYVLNLNEFSESYEINIGKLIHSIFEHVYENDFDFDKYYTELVPNYNFSKMELILNKRLVFIAKIVASRLRKEQEESYITKEYKEFELQTNIKGFNLVGYIDSILLAEYRKNKFCEIIDYKTGSVNIEDKIFKFGLNLQLPIYSYLVRQSEEFKNVKISGVYYVHFNAKTLFNKDDYNENIVKKEVLKEGIFSKYDEAQFAFEPKLNSLINTTSEYVSGLESGRLSNEDSDFKILPIEDKIIRVVNEKEVEYDPLLDQLFDYFKESLTNKDFKISPFYRGSGEDFEVCNYCPYKDICFKKKKNIRKQEGLFKVKGIDVL